jgi:hypothetical protein
MRGFFAITFCLTGLSLFGQTNTAQVAPGAREQFVTLLNKPAMVLPVGIISLGRSWFRLEIDTHVITNEAGLEQVAAVLIDMENSAQITHGKKGRLLASIVGREANETVVDFVMISMAPLGIHIKTPYRAAVKNTEKTGTKTIIEIRQLASDSSSNKDIKNLFAVRYAEEITINGKPYTYIRIFSISDVNTGILPGAKGILENNAAPSNIEALELVIAAAKKR